ncbi:MAG: hypothetical protein LBS76_00850 [Mycoplasmataceae bacterium]|jgi:hypothetical protein|nr:hypothetical protein [Mycoplasmataceae bacterium]
MKLQLIVNNTILDKSFASKDELVSFLVNGNDVLKVLKKNILNYQHILSEV